MTIRLLIADDEALVRRGFTIMLDAEPDLAVVGETADGRRAVDFAATLVVDIVLGDIRMPVADRIEATRRIVAAGGPRVTVITTFCLDTYVPEELCAPARAAFGSRSPGPNISSKPSAW